MKRLFIPVLASMCLLVGCSAEGDQTAAIIRVLEKESTTWRSGDVKAHADCWVIRPYGRILVSTTTGECYDNPAEAAVNPPPGQMGKGGTFKNLNYRFSIHKDNAWVSHDEESVSVEGKTTYSHEIRILEKVNGEWKLVATSIHLYNPK